VQQADKYLPPAPSRTFVLEPEVQVEASSADQASRIKQACTPQLESASGIKTGSGNTQH